MAAPKVRKGRRVICHATGIYGNSLDYFKAPDGFYYQTKELYEQKKQESDYYRQVVTRMASYMGYEPGDVFPTVITRGLMQFKHYGYAAVLATMEECQSKIEYALASRSFGSDYQKASYLMAILTNNICRSYASKCSALIITYNINDLTPAQRAAFNARKPFHSYQSR